MWKYNSDYKKWGLTDDRLSKDNFDYLKQELSSVRFYSKCLSGATYLPINNLDNIYDILGSHKPRNWYISLFGSQYTNTLIPSEHAEPISITSSYDYYTKYNSEYGLTLKNLFTPDRLIKDSIKNYIYVDVATLDQIIDITESVINRTIDGVRLKEGHRVLIKNQKSVVALPNTTDPDTYFEGEYKEVLNLGATIEYEYYDETNGIYEYKNNLLVKTNDLDDYNDCIRFSVIAKLGDVNREKQFHLSRLLNGYYPTSSLNQPMQFIENHNWLLRNRVDYNNLFEINYYDIIKHATQSYTIDGFTYTIPERVISIGEFGVILNHQESLSNVINNKYKVNLRSIAQTTTHYWIVGDEGILLKVRKHDFVIERIEVDCTCPRNVVTTNLKSISFFNDLKGVAVGELNTILVTNDGGYKWERIRISDFDTFYFNKVLYYSPNAFFIGGNAGVFIEFKNDISGWVAYRRRVSRFIDDDDEYLLVDNINDILYTNINTWGLSYSYSNQSIQTNKEILFLVTDDSKIIAHDINDSTNFDFIYLDLPDNYNDIRNIVRKESTNYFYFTGIDNNTSNSGLFEFDITNFQYIGVGNSYSNTVASTFSATFKSSLYSNEIFDYKGEQILVCGNESLLNYATYSATFSFEIFDFTYESRLKSKLLFLDYDIASKLNFFTDAGEYRLPNSVSFTFSSSTNSSLTFHQILPENNWITYWQDRQMTFEYLSANSQGSCINPPMTDLTKVLISPEFEYSDSSVLNINTLTNDSSDILYLAPTILNDGHSRFNGAGVTISVPPSYDMYLYDYLMVAKAPFSYSVSKGDVLRLESGILDENFIVNNIVSPSSVIPATTDIFAVYDTTSMNLSDAATASIQLKDWFADYCQDNPFYQGNLYILPSGTERWLNIPDLIYTGLLPITFLVGSPSVSWDILSEIVSYTQSITNINGGGTLASKYLAAFGSTWSAPDNLVVISFIDEANADYHANSLTYSYILGTYSQPLNNYITDYNQFVNNRSPLTGATSSKYSYFKGVLYPIVRGGSFLNGVCASLVLQQVSALYGYTMSQSEVDSIPGIATDYTTGYLGLSFSLIVNDTTSGWNAGETRINVTPVIQNNPYSSLTDSNGDVGLLQHGWSGYFDKRNRVRDTVNNINVVFNPFNPVDFAGDLNSLMESASGGDKYLYMFSEFNQNIITELINSTNSISLTNLNRYGSENELVDRFNLHPISNAYELSYDSGTMSVDAKFNNLTSYYNLATNVTTDSNTSQMRYTNGFLNFGYTPTYNLLDYLESINDPGDPSPTFGPDKEYYAMPDYRGIPLPGTGNFTSNQVYIDYNYSSNKITFGSELKFEWESLFINTFVDIHLYESSIYGTVSSSSTDRLLVMNKYYNETDDNYVVEFHKKINYTLTIPLYFIDIISRRKLSQISEDLQYINNIQRPSNNVQYTGGVDSNLPQSWDTWYDVNYTRYERELNFKISTDSYTKIMLSDSETLESISAVIYTDYKNELAMNMTRLEEAYNVPILNTANFITDEGSRLFISCSEQHNLKTGDGVVLEFTGDVDGNGDPVIIGSSVELNPQYFGYHTVTVVNKYDFYVNMPYGNPTIVGNDRGYVKYVKKDPFLNYQPVDIIDVGVDKRGKRAIELKIENVKLTGSEYSLVNVDFNNYRFRLVDGLNIESLATKYPWIYEAEISKAVIGEREGILTWYNGTWECGRWFGGEWISGSWLSGDWYGGIWNSKFIKDNYINVEVDEKSSNEMQSIWYGGRWYDGIWNNGTWVNGRWYDGTWNNGTWYKGIWNDGIWNNGNFNGGVWVLGTWNNGIFNTDNEPSYWLDGKWYGGDFENGMWYNGIFEQKNAESRFGTNAYNSRTATWHSGKWVSGTFHSRLNINDEGLYDVSDVHKYSIWYTGSWFSGDFYGGIAYNMDFKSGVWYGGILEDIQIIGFIGTGSPTSDNYFILNGIFKFNIGDEINVIDNQIGNTYSSFGSNDVPSKYKVLYTTEDSINKWTNVYVNRVINTSVVAPVDLGIRVVSNFRNCNWRSGIWTNGIYETGLWEGGIWYNGIFKATWM